MLSFLPAQAARQAAEQRAQDLAAQVDKLTAQAIEAAVEAQRTLDAAVHRSARDADKAEVRKPITRLSGAVLMPAY